MIHAKVEVSTRRLSTAKSHGRVINAISTFLRKQLSVPHIYQKPRIPGGSGTDVLAVDRGGSGDVYGVQIQVEAILPTPSKIIEMLGSLRELPCHYKYLAINSSPEGMAILSKLNAYEELFDRSGIGRFGILAYDDQLLQVGAVAPSIPITVVVQPERFRMRGAKLDALERFLDQAQPDIQVRI